MANFSNLFITYNPKEDIEQNTALRMQTIAHLYALSLELPARMAAKNITSETQQRIARSSVVLAISLTKMSKLLQEELAYAIEQNKPIVVLYDKKKGKTINFGAYKNFKEIHVDFNQTDQALHEVASFLKETVKNQEAQSKKKSDSETGVLLGVLGIGLGLLALWAISKEE
jgi:hypothetical protein